LTWAFPSAARLVTSWRVVTDTDSLSDHRFIQIGVRATPSEVLSRRAKEGLPRRGILRKLDEDSLIAAVLAKSLCLPKEGESISDSVERIGAILTKASDVAMPQSRSSPRRSAYWWSEEIAELRRSSTKARRLLTRARRRGNQARIATAHEAYRAARNLMRQAIRKAKAESWEELLASLDADLWGRPYKLVLGKMRAAAPSVAGTLSPTLLNEVVGTLFPVRGRCIPPRQGHLYRGGRSGGDATGVVRGMSTTRS